MEVQLSGGSCSGRNYSGKYVQGAKVQVEIALWGFSQG